MKLKLRKIGNSYGVILPRFMVTDDNKKEGFVSLVVEKEVQNTQNVITNYQNSEKKIINVITSKPRPKTCPKHHGNWITCGCDWNG